LRIILINLFPCICGIHEAIISMNIASSNKLKNVLRTIVILYSKFYSPYFDQLNTAFELSSFFNSFVTSTFEGDRIYTPFSICCNSPPKA